MQIRISSTLFTPTHFSFSEPIPQLHPFSPPFATFRFSNPIPPILVHAEKEQRDERKAKNVTQQINAFYCSPSLPTPPWAMMFALLKIIRFSVSQMRIKNPTPPPLHPRPSPLRPYLLSIFITVSIGAGLFNKPRIESYTILA